MDVLVMLLTTVLIALSNIAVGVGVGLAVSCAAYAWDAAALLGVRYYLDPDPETGEVTKVYEVIIYIYIALPTPETRLHSSACATTWTPTLKRARSQKSTRCKIIYVYVRRKIIDLYLRRFSRFQRSSLLLPRP